MKPAKPPLLTNIAWRLKNVNCGFYFIFAFYFYSG
nr:MAG TPA: hypothetical protein [Bacteriophage sp.]